MSTCALTTVDTDIKDFHSPCAIQHFEDGVGELHYLGMSCRPRVSSINGCEYDGHTLQ